MGKLNDVRLPVAAAFHGTSLLGFGGFAPNINITIRDSSGHSDSNSNMS